MQSTIGIAKARERFSELVNRAAFGGEHFVVERRGTRLAALMGAAEYEQLMALLAEEGINDHVHGIPVRVRYDGQRYFISDDIIDLYGAGATLDDARQDYWLAARAAYDDLAANAGRLAPYLQEHLVYLQQVMAAEATP